VDCTLIVPWLRTADIIHSHNGQNLGFEELAEFLCDHVEDEDEGEGRGQDGVVVQVLPPDAGSVGSQNFETQFKYMLLIKTVQK
jgi:hypothetical protein